ncbi:sodium-dependent glucose transporter 1A-like [Acanthaster planci]|uniref:Sodium-dependent glucose transporter 1A-like n=1 Tax=Acanthaster planci TaxID=133434 RepID=A0A8B7ZJZ2_ACAPL|nr:sodium-dependent glucose transporter 1A-like [Acanthaster planci]
MADSDDDDVLFSKSRTNQQTRGLLGNGVKNVDDVMNGPKEDRRLKRTLALCAAFLSLGLAIAVLGPTLVALKDQLAVSLPKISYVFVGRSIGYLAGSVVGGVTFEWFHPSLLMAVSLLASGIGLIVAPFCHTLWILAAVISVVGLAMGALDTGANVVCLRLWGKRSSPFLQALHFCFAVGAFLAPLLAAPFIPTDIILATNRTAAVPKTSFVHTWGEAGTTKPVEQTTLLENASTVTIGETTISTTATSMTSAKSATMTTAITTKDTTVNNVHETTTAKDTTVAPMEGATANGIENATTTQTTEREESNMSNQTVQTAVSTGNSTVATTKGARNITTTPTTGTEESNQTAVTTSVSTANPTSESQVEVSSAVPPGQFRNVYIIIGVFSMLVSTSFFYFFCTSPVRPPPSSTPGQYGDRESKNMDFKYTVLGLMFLFYFLYVGAEVTFGGYIFTFATQAQDGKLMNETSASLLNSAFWGSFATGRGLSICLASVLEPHMMLILDMVGCIASSIALSWCGDTNSIVLWVGTVVLGLSMASLFPAGISWLESYHRVTGSMATILVVGSAFGEMVFPLLMGWMLRKKDIREGSGFLQTGPIGLMYFMLATSGLTAIIFIVMQYLAKQHGVEQTKPGTSNPAQDLKLGLHEAINMEELIPRGNAKQSSKPIIPKPLRIKKHTE